MTTFIDKCYHVACAIPRVQTAIGLSFAIKDLVGIIKDIAMSTLFKGYADDVTTNLDDLNTNDNLLTLMSEQNNYLYLLGSKSSVHSKYIASIEGMNDILNDLKVMGLFMPISEITHMLHDNEQDPLIKIKAYTDARIEAAIQENNRQLNDLKKKSFFTETVPANERLYNLATAVISAIPVVGTVYNVGALGYFYFIKS